MAITHCNHTAITHCNHTAITHCNHTAITQAITSGLVCQADSILPGCGFVRIDDMDHFGTDPASRLDLVWIPLAYAHVAWALMPMSPPTWIHVATHLDPIVVQGSSLAGSRCLRVATHLDPIVVHGSSQAGSHCLRVATHLDPIVVHGSSQPLVPSLNDEMGPKPRHASYPTHISRTLSISQHPSHTDPSPLRILPTPGPFPNMAGPAWRSFPATDSYDPARLWLVCVSLAMRGGARSDRSPST
jgi:hypothetical protein